MKRIIYHFCFPYFIFHRHSNVIQSDRPYKEKWGRDRSWRLNPPQGVTERQGGISVLQDMKLCSRYVMCAAYDIRGLKGMAWNKLRSSKFTDVSQVNRMTHPHTCMQAHTLAHRHTNTFMFPSYLNWIHILCGGHHLPTANVMREQTHLAPCDYSNTGHAMSPHDGHNKAANHFSPDTMGDSSWWGQVRCFLPWLPPLAEMYRAQRWTHLII